MVNGGKASSLIKLRKGGFNVPPFLVFDAASSEGDLTKIDRDLPGAEYFAVRSSAESEDSKEKSYAGHFYSAIGVPRQGVFAEFAKVVKSFGGMSGAVIVQEFIPSDKAGVMFSEVGGKTVINSTIGLCSMVVEGRSCDEYVIGKNGRVISKDIAPNKDIRLFIAGSVVAKTAAAESLNAEEIEKLSKTAGSIQTFFGSPQDIEWCFKDGVLHILQSRPITRGFRPASEEEYFFDSANIAESYAGIVLPLTCHYARFAYENAYKDLLRMSGVSKRRLEAHKDIFGNLLGFFYGRMYYNMNNWYRMMAFVPGYRRNKANLESMITSNVREEIDTSVAPSLPLKVFYPLIALIKILSFGMVSRFFRSAVKKEIRRLQSLDFGSLNRAECVNLFEKLTKKLLRRWYITLENDFFVMTYLGILKKFAGEEKIQRLIVFKSKATEQVSALSRLAGEIKAIPDLWKAVQVGDIGVFEKMIPANLGIQSALRAYLAEFGGRFANELKLESADVDEHSAKLLEILKAYGSYEPPQKEASDPDIDLPVFKKMLFRAALKRFKKYASQREDFRLLRSNTFSISRRLFKRIGALLAREGTINEADDIFYASLEEVISGNPQDNGMRKSIGERKKEYASYVKMSPPAHFSTKDSNAPPAPVEKTRRSNDIIDARPASDGIVRGRVRIFKDFAMPSKVDFDILVASHTDPGWTALIALSRGMIIEHGGVLSHASIVARELNIPTVIGAAGATDILKDGQIVEINGSTGEIKII